MGTCGTSYLRLALIVESFAEKRNGNRGKDGIWELKVLTAYSMFS